MSTTRYECEECGRQYAVVAVDEAGDWLTVSIAVSAQSLKQAVPAYRTIVLEKLVKGISGSLKQALLDRGIEE